MEDLPENITHLLGTLFIVLAILGTVFAASLGKALGRAKAKARKRAFVLQKREWRLRLLSALAESKLSDEVIIAFLLSTGTNAQQAKTLLRKFATFKAKAEATNTPS